MGTAFPVTRIPGIQYLQILSRQRGWPYIASWMHRITGVMLSCYIILHLLTLSALNNPNYFDHKIKLYAAIFPVSLEWLLAVPVIYHSLNGGRLILYEIFGNRQDNTVLKWVLGFCISYMILLGIFMIMGNQVVSAIFFWTYIAAISTFITYLTVVRINCSGASFLWKMQRISGAFLFLMIPAHMLFMHLDPAVGRDAHLIINRMDNIFIKCIDLVLVISVLYHSAYGLIAISKDYLSSGRVQTTCMAGVVFIMIIFAWIGIKLTIFI